MANGGRIDYTIGFKTDKAGLETVKNELKQLGNMSKEQFFKINPDLSSLNQADLKLKEIKQTVSKVQGAFDSALDTKTGVTNVTKLTQSLKNIGVNKIASDFKLMGSSGVKAFNDISKQVMTTNLKFKQTESLLTKMGTTLSNTIRWQISSKAINSFTSSIQQAYGYIQHLDTSLNDIRIVTNKSAEDMAEFAVQANKAAKALGQSTTNYTEASLIYYQQGLSDKEVAARAETTLKAANVTGQSAAQVSEQLTAVWNGYQIQAENTEASVDKLAAVAATTASDLEELSVGMSKVASSANAMGVDMDQLNAQISTIISVTRQAPESVGTALKTIYARMGDLKLGGEDEFGIKLGDVSGTLDQVGISVLDANGNLREMGDIIEDVAAKWNVWTEAQQIAIAEVMAGKRQYNNLIALFENWDMYSKALETSRNATGTLQHQQDIYMESTKAHLQQLKTQWEDLYDSILDSDTINDVADGLTKIVKLLTSFVDSIGGGKGVLLGLGTIATQVFGKTINTELTNLIVKLQNAKQDTLLLQQEIQNMQFASGATEGTEAFNAIARLKKEVQGYYQIMSKEEIQAVDGVIRKIADLYSEQDVLNAKAKELEAIYEQQEKEEEQNLQKQKDIITEINKKIKAEEDYVKLLASEQVTIGGKTREGAGGTAAQSTDIKSGKIEAGIKTYEFAEKQLSKNGEIRKIITEINTQTETVIKKNGKMTKSYQELLEKAKQAFKGVGLDEYVKKIERLEISLNKLASGQAANPKNSLNNFNKNLDNDIKKAQKNIQEHKKNLQSLQKDYEKETEKLNENTEALKENNQQREENLNKTQQEADKKGAEARQNENQLKTGFFNELQIRDTVDSFTKLSSGITSTGFAIQSLTSGIKALQDETMSTSKQVLQFLMSLGMSIPMFVNGISQLRKAAKALNGLNKATKVFTGSLVGIIAVITTVTILNTKYKKTLDDQAEASKKATEAAKERYEAIKQEEEHIEEIEKKYDELNKQIEEHEISTEDAKEQIYDLCKQYDLQDLAVKTLVSEYEDLKDIINEVHQAINNNNFETSQDVVETSRRTAKYELQKNTSWLDKKLDLGTGQTDFQKELNELSKSAGLGDIVLDKYGHIDTDKLIDLYATRNEELFDLIDSYINNDNVFNKDAQKLNDYLTKSAESLSTYKEALQNESYASATLKADEIVDPKSIKNVENYIDARKKVEEAVSEDFNSEEDLKKFVDSYFNGIDEIKEYIEDAEIHDLLFNEVFKEDKNVLQEAEQYGKDIKTSLTKGFFESVVLPGLSIGGGVDLANRPQIDTGELSAWGEQSGGYATLYSSTFSNEEGTKAINFTPIIVDENGNYIGVLTPEELQNYAEEVIAGGEDYKHLQIGLPFYGEDAIENASAMAEKIHEIHDYLYSSDTNEEDFIQHFQDEYASYTEDQKEFLYTNAQLAQDIANVDEFWALYSERKPVQESISLIEGVLGKTELKDEDIDNLFNSESFTSGFSIDKETFSGLNFEDQMNALSDYYEELYRKEIDFQSLEKTGIDEAVNKRREALEQEQEEFGNAITNLEQTLVSKYGDVGKKIVEEIFSDEETLNIFNRLFNGEAGFVDKIKSAEYLKEYNITIEDLADSFKKYQSATNQYGKTLKSTIQITDNFNTIQKQLNNIEKKNIKSSFDFTSSLEKTKNEIKNLNSEIDNLQSTYQTLQDVVEDYNEDGTLTLDNLQKILEMDSLYVASLEIVNGELVLNDETYNSLIQTKIQKMKLDAAETYMNELLAIANGQAAEAGLELQSVTSSNTATLYDMIDACNSGVNALYRLADAEAAAGVNFNATKTATEAFYNRIKLIDNLAAQPTSKILGKSSGSGSGKSGGSGSAKESDKEDFVNYEADIYHKINGELEDIEEKLGRIQTIGDHTWGKSQVDVLNQEKELLDENIDKLEEKIDLQKKDLSVRKKQLENEGFNFSEDGAVIVNREEQIKALWDGYDAMVAQYNAMSADAQESYKATLEAEKDRVQQIADALDKYEDVYGEYQNALDDWLDKQYEIIETQIEAFNAEVEVKLTLNQAERDWIDFKKEVLDDIDDLDFGGRIAASLATLGTLLGPSGEISMMMDHLNESVYEIGESMQGIETNFTHDGVFDTAAAKEQLEDYRDKLMDAVHTAKEQVDGVADTYLDALDDADDKIQKQIEGWENIGDQIKHDINLIKKISGEKSYEALDRLYEQQHQNNLETIEAERISADFWAKRIQEEKKALETAEEGSVEWKTHNKALEEANENWNSAVQKMNSTVMDALDALQEWQDNQMASIEQRLDQAFSGGIGLDQLEKEWNLVNDVANRYLDNVERAIEMDDLDTLFDKALNQANLTVSAQEQINKLRDEEFGKLEDREKISQYDIDLAKSRLAILQQQIALEDAQKNKSNLRLRRDSQGNYTYQYTGDDSQIDDAENGLMSAKKDWYELVKNRNLDLRNDIIKNRQELSKAIMELNNTDWTNNEEGRKKQLELIALYEQKEQDLMWDTENATRDFFDGTAEHFKDVENSSILPQWETTVNQLVNNWSGEGEASFTGAVKKGIADIQATQETFAERTQNILNTAGINYQTLYTTGIDPTKQKLETLVDTNDNFAISLDETNSKLNDYANKLKEVERGYNDLESAASSAIQSANEMLRQLANTAVDAVNQINNAINSANSASAFQGYSNYSHSTSQGGGSGLGGSSWTSTGYKGNINTGKKTGLYINWPSTGEPIPFYRINNGDPVYITNDTQFNYLKDHVFPMYEEYDKKYKNKKLEKKYKSSNSWTLRSGGYTGTWSGSNLADDYKAGRLALLHQKELVLNESDTENILSAVAAIREIDTNKYTAGILDTVISQISSLLNTTSGLFNKVRTVDNSNNTSNDYNGDVIINADFSGVKSADAIYEALVELENYGIQTMYANS